MRVLVVHPGPAFSVADVADGWARAFRDLGCETVVYSFDYRLEFYSKAMIERNDGTYQRALTDEMAVLAAMECVGNEVFRTWPDLVVFVSAFWVPMDLVDYLRVHGIKTVMLATESPYEDDRHASVAAHFDAVVLNDPTNIEQILRVQRQTFYAPHSYDPAVHYPAPSDKTSDVCFIGTGYPSRIQFLEQVDWSGIDLAIRGNWGGLRNHELHKYLRQDDADICCDNSETVEWYRGAKASLNLYRKEANRPELVEGWSMGPREIELAATGCFYLTEERGENRHVLPFVPTFTTPDDFSEKVRWWLDHDTARADVIARAREAVAGWTFQERARKLLALLYPHK